MNTDSRSTNVIVDELLTKINGQRLECDLLVSLFYSSATSSRRFSVCEPFPSAFKSPTGSKQFDNILESLNTLPPLSLLTTKESLYQLPTESLKLLDFIVNNNNNDFTVKLIDYKEFERETLYLEDLLEHLKTSQLPSKVFRFNYDPTVKEKNAEYDRLAKQFGTLFGYHGSANDSWNNIIRGRGFANQYISETCLFGHGFYFSSDSKVSHSFVKYGRWWDKSEFGDRVGCLSGCDIIDTDQTNRGIKVSPATSPLPSPRPTVYTEEDKELPDHYILSKIGGHIRVKYLLLFEDRSNSSGSSQTIPSPTPTSPGATTSSSPAVATAPAAVSIFTRISQWRPSPLSILVFSFIIYMAVLVFVGRSQPKKKPTKPLYFQSRLEL
ncbi:hypothetical protein SAMD00019534_019530 [Acytostelium subglobosum LB1]|uniref:hypothetical protein n=1 Tax=Acytostelium subglobosum LB1 TaxID=1410327 RepID=UPI000644DFDB|nr:hypothetical protein SAMD00019534_019530 [Acytostelium subglobosum LB1]GAM18778.1 hypothetical protein SAMD00019534_019530 [Acytostelium subglobosum LB1]|eukprot:XP_012757998.1 hypothetical protein SAMD00019534_019530 [Acytostelium subglobosum LB1]